jgi:nitrate reductase NapAB chaperone NapD
MGLLTRSLPILRNLSLPNSLRIATGTTVAVSCILTVAQFILVLTTDQPERMHDTFSRMYPRRDVIFLLNLVYHELQIRGDNNNDAIRAEAITLNLILGGRSVVGPSDCRNRY